MSLTAFEDGNFRAFSSSEVVDFYRNYSGLQPTEIYLFEKFVSQGVSILDIGVGCGRTTPHLSKKASRYIGIDYVKAMVDFCAAQFPEYAFHCADATCLRRFDDDSFNIVVFSFNGIDAIPTREDRIKCFSEVFRVLMPDGRFIFSSHNARMLFRLPDFKGAGTMRKINRLVRAAFKSAPAAFSLLSSGAFYAGAGYYLDPAHGGIRGYCSTPELVEQDVSSIGFHLLEVVGSNYPQKVSRYCTPWYYYVLAKQVAINSSIT